LDLTDLAKRVIERLKASAPDREVQFRVHEGLRGRGDVRLVTILFENLLGNAWKFTSKRRDAEVEFGRALHSGRAAYFIRDNGAGFDMAYVGKLFGAFQRLHAVTDFEGTGIGLATVQRIVQRHGGRVWAEGEVGVGATFYFTLGEEGPG
jgi:light-regulated signal transduction histidine kinase (bacteriophytochrome)